MIIDCDSCTAGPRACADCVVSHLLATPAGRVAPAGRVQAATRHRQDGRPADLDATELAAVDALAAGGLLPPLRLVTREEPEVATRGDVPGGSRVRFGEARRAG